MMILKLTSMPLYLTSNCQVFIWLLLSTSVCPSICAFDILLGQQPFSAGPLVRRDNRVRSLRSAVVVNRPWEHSIASKYVDLLKIRSGNDVPNTADVLTLERQREPTLLKLRNKSYMRSLLKDLNKWTQTKKIVSELRRRNNIPARVQLWKKPARKPTRGHRKYHGEQFPKQPSSIQIFPVDVFTPSEDIVMEAGQWPVESEGDMLEDFIPLGSVSHDAESRNGHLVLNQAIGFEDISIRPTKPSFPEYGFGQFTGLVDAKVDSREVRQDSEWEDGGFVDDNTSCAGITDRMCASDDECACQGFYTCVENQCQLLYQPSHPTILKNVKRSGGGEEERKKRWGDGEEWEVGKRGRKCGGGGKERKKVWGEEESKKRWGIYCIKIVTTLKLECQFILCVVTGSNLTHSRFDFGVNLVSMFTANGFLKEHKLNLFAKPISTGKEELFFITFTSSADKCRKSGPDLEESMTEREGLMFPALSTSVGRWKSKTPESSVFLVSISRTTFFCKVWIIDLMTSLQTPSLLHQLESDL
ncbi:hypothetical protein Btru_057584 [Bulinus truncatus]|nr:hypothetical protein Btru_057584 [Bulinus truncatus]